MTSEPRELPVVHEIQPKDNFSFGLKELWQYRELFFFFTWRDVKVKYKQAVLGMLWAVLQPLLLVLVFTLILHRGLRLDSGDMPYPVFAFSGLLIWNIFAGGLSGAAESMVANANIIRKIYFPRLVIPLSSILVALVDFLFALIIFLGLVVWYQVPVQPWRLIIFVPAGVLLCSLTTLGLGTLLAALNVKYRDFRYVIPFFIQLLFFLSPVMYSPRMFEITWLNRLIYLNPIAGAIELMRAPFSGTPVDWLALSGGLIISILFLIGGIYVFRRTEAFFADLA